MSTAEKVIENLRQFNRKERFYLVGTALGNPKFKLGQDFRSRLQSKLDLEVPEAAFAAMDYHLDWIYASVFLASQSEAKPRYKNTGEITATSEDIDFLIAYQEGEYCHIILAEAKGDSAFSNKQLGDKACRLKQIFGEDGRKWAGVIPHSALMSPYRPTKRLNHKCWPDWMHPDGKFKWVELRLPDHLKKVTVCDEKGIRDRDGQHWKVTEIPVRGFHPDSTG